MLRQMGLESVGGSDDELVFADVVLMNTCSVRQNARNICSATSVSLRQRRNRTAIP